MNITPDQIPQIVVGLALLATTYTDIKTGKIPNNITLPLIALGIFHHALFGVITFGVFGLVLATLIHYTLWFMGVERGGDAKLLMGIGAFGGVAFTLELSLWLALLYLPVGLLILAVTGKLGNLKASVQYLIAKSAGRLSEDAKPPPKTMLKTAPVIAVATVISYTTDLFGGLL